MAVRELTPDLNEHLYEPRMKSVIEDNKTAKKKQFVKFAVSGIEILIGGALVAFTVTKKANTTPMLDVLGCIVGMILVYDGINRVMYK